MTISGLTIRDGNAAFGDGGGLYNSGTLALTGSTIVSNTAHSGGGLSNYGTLTFTSSTISNNAASGSGGGVWSSFGTATARDSLLAGNTTDCSGALTSQGYNLIQNATGCTISGTLTGVVTGTDPLLGSLQANGGPTLTHALLAGSPAINAGDPAGCQDNIGNILSADQRGAPRVGRCDIGAYEAGLSASKSVSGTFTPGGLVTYTVRLSNPEGALDLTGVSLTDTLPAQVAYLPNSLSANYGTGVANGGVITWTGTVLSNTATVITFEATISNTARSVVITNTALSSWGGVTIPSSAGVDTTARLYLPVVARDYCPNYFDDFSNPNSGWYVHDDSAEHLGYQDGAYQILTKLAGGSVIAGYIIRAQAPACSRQNYQVDVDARWAGTLVGQNSYGLTFGVVGNSKQFYEFLITTSQEYALARQNADGSVTNIASGSSSTIHPGLAPNHLTLTRNGSQIALYCNGTFLGSWTDSTITGPTGMGVMTTSYHNGPMLDARFDNFSVTALP